MSNKRVKALKKSLTGFIVLLLLLSSFPISSYGETSSENAINDVSGEAESYLWTEGENYAAAQGGYHTAGNLQASGGEYLLLQTNTPNTSATAQYQVDIPETGDYDIWVLATGMSPWMSAWSWKLDSGSYTAPPVVTENSIFGAEGMPFYWHKLSSTELTQGQHNLEFLTNAPRVGGAGGTDGLYNQGIDAITFVPVGWGWQPNGLNKPVAPAVPETPAADAYLWTEGENYHSSQGGYRTSGNLQASEGTYLLLQTNKPNTSATVQYQVTIPETGSYDIWVLATGMSIWMSSWSWKLDEGSYLAPPVVTENALFAAEGMPFYWHKLSSTELTQGKHNIGFLTNTPRQGAPDGLYNQGIDAIAVVPVGWGWKPNGISKPFNKAAVKFEYVSGTLDKTIVNREEQVNVTVINKAVEEIKGSLSFFVELVYNGEVVSRAAREFTKKSWAAGEEYAESIQLTVPFNAPKGANEIRTGIVDVQYNNATNGEGSLKVDNINIEQEEENTSKPELSAAIFDLQVQSTQGSTRSFEGHATYQLNQAVDFNTTGYLSFYQGDVLWHVAELTALNTSTLQAGVAAEVQFSFELPVGMPAGSYAVKLGLHKLNAEQDLPKQVTVAAAVNPTNTKYKPLSHGTYLDRKLGQSHMWYANQSHTMIWDGKPFVPIGGMFTSDYLLFYSKSDPAANKANWEKDVEVLQYMKAHGAMDMYINTAVMEVPAWAWQQMLDYLEEEGFTYGLQVQGAQGLMLSAYMPRAYDAAGVLKVENVVGSGEVTLTVPTFQIPGYVDTMSALYTVINPVTGEVIQSGEGEVRKVDAATLELHANVSLQGTGSTPYTVYFTPKVKYSGHTLRNIWDAGDSIINSMVDTLSKVKLGPNFRLFVDPVTNESGIYNGDEGFLFDSPIYSVQFVAWLKKKYPTLNALNQAWKMSTPVESYEVAARLIPIVRGEGTATWNNQLYLVDKEHPESTYTADAHRGILWDDFVDFREGSYNEYLMKFSDAITSVVDVPVVFKHVGTPRKYFVNDKQSGGFAGIGGEIYGDNEYRVREVSGYTFSLVEQSAQTLWFLTTETQLDENMDRKYLSGEKGYPDKETMFNHFDLLLDTGSKGIYDFLFNCDYFTSCQESYAYYTAKPVQFDWLKEYKDGILTPESIDHIESYKPEPYYVYPAGESWWMLNRRNIVLEGDDYRGTAVLQTFDNKWVLPTFDPGASTNVMVVNLEDDPATTLYGPGLLAQGSLKDGKRNIVYMGYRKNLGDLPEIDQYFTNEYTELEDGTKVQVLNPNATSTTKVLYSTTDGKAWGIRDGKLWIITDPDWMIEATVNVPKRQIKYLNELDFSTDSGNGNGNENGNGNGNGQSSGNTATSVVTVENGKAIAKLGKDQSLLSVPFASIGELPLQVQAGSVIVNVDRELLKTWNNQVGNEVGTAIEVLIKPVSEAGDRISTQGAATQITIAGQVYEISIKLKKADGSAIEITQVTGGVEITLPYDANGVDAELLGIYYYNEKTKLWEYVGGKVNSPAKTLTVKLQHLSKYAVVEYNKTFSDMLATHWASRIVKVLSAKHIVNGVSDQLFQPAGETTRAEFVSLLVRALNLEVTVDEQMFKDVKLDAWYAGSVQAASKAGIVSGISADLFAPNAPITRAEMTVLVARALALKAEAGEMAEFADSKDIPVWATSSVVALKKAGLIDGKGNNLFYPQANATRAEAAKFILGVMNHL
ncbi:S-layer homology domain-containing protein [Cohnella abietis]|uniref:SLH domain-containing protein n=1 Tax=Cohnella abietis TaxID=2507935 RepID=A0A3T1D0D5_9BACL|nr:S-layer homology domain-containing protein [Cohnella abietis]BBI31560.1 hypothetical protein KCTCHS21_09590 [Cohnella abietis]